MFHQGHYLLCAVMLASIAITILTIFLGSLQLSAAAYGSTSFDGDMSAATAWTLLAAFVFAVHLAVACQVVLPGIVGKKERLPRPPSTLADVMLYIIFSPGLREDLLLGAGSEGKRQKIRRLVDEDRRYGLGTFGPARICGVEQHYAYRGKVHRGL